MTVQTGIPGKDGSCGQSDLRHSSSDQQRRDHRIGNARDRQQHDRREQIILGDPGSGSEVAPLGRSGARSRHKKGATVQQRVLDANWSLGMALAWITSRTEQAVLNIKDGRWAPIKAAIRDLLTALRSGKLIAHGMFEGERIPHPIETAVWSTFEIVVKPGFSAKFLLRLRARLLLSCRGWALRKPGC